VGRLRLAALTFSAALAWILIGPHAFVGGSARASSLATVRPVWTIWQRLDRRCEAVARASLPPYPWPIRPFHREHPIRGYFGDPRTVFSDVREPALSFHNGVDIAAWRGNYVYPVVSGRVVDVDGDRVVVASSFDRRFQYIHIYPQVRAGEQVTASRTVLGLVADGWGHVHLSEIRSGCAVNPLADGHLTPFEDTTTPQIRAIAFVDPAGHYLSRFDLSGWVRVIVNAQDRPPLPAPGEWRRMPVTPALLTWALETIHGHVLLHGVGADFRYSEPPASDFCRVYAPGTLQNFAAVAGVFHWARPGRYLFDMTPRPIDTSLLHPGAYLLAVSASNVDDHTAIRTERIDVGRRRLLEFVRGHPDRRCR
jgi:hypothetical protein